MPTFSYIHEIKFLISNWIPWSPNISLLIIDQSSYPPVWALRNFESAIFARADWISYQLSPPSRSSCPQHEVLASGCKPYLAKAKILKAALRLGLNDTKVILNDQGVTESDSFEIWICSELSEIPSSSKNWLVEHFCLKARYILPALYWGALAWNNTSVTAIL